MSFKCARGKNYILRKETKFNYRDYEFLIDQNGNIKNLNEIFCFVMCGIWGRKARVSFLAFIFFRYSIRVVPDP